MYTMLFRDPNNYALFLFAALSLLFVLLFLLRILFAALFLSSAKGESTLRQEDITALVPILSGEPLLTRNLLANLEATESMRFFWLIDRSDTEAAAVASALLTPEYAHRVKILDFIDAPRPVNPKAFKLAGALAHVKTKYLMVLDDDTRLDMNSFSRLSAPLEEADPALVTGIPYHCGNGGFFSSLLAAFVNSQSFFVYFPMAFLGKTKTINGMYYLGKTSLFTDFDAFSAIEDYLCDDYALAFYLSGKGVRLVQTCGLCDVQTSLDSFRDYAGILGRWLFFANVYLKDTLDPAHFFLVLLPAILPPVLLISSFLAGWGALAGAFFLLLGKSAFQYAFRLFSLKKKEPVGRIGLEVLSDLLLPFLYLGAFFKKPVIHWRNKKIPVRNGRIFHEEETT